MIKLSEEVSSISLPDHWGLVELQSLSEQITDGEHKTPRRVSKYEGFYLLSARNVTNEGIINKAGTYSASAPGKNGDVTVQVTFTEDAIKAVKDFVSDYNDTLKFFSDNSDVSKRIGRMNTMFADNTYRSGNYKQIGITVGNDGKMTLDEEKLAKVLSEDAENYAKAVENGDTDRAFHSRVADVLGKD